MSQIFPAKPNVSKLAIVLLSVIAGSVISASVVAQDSSQTNPAPPNPKTAPSSAHSLIKPGDRNCLRHTGSLIPPKNGDCLSVAGRSYGGDELRNTGAINNARALQMLDPSISLGH